MATHVNAYRAELDQAVRAAEGALGEVRKKYQAYTDKLDMDAMEAAAPVVVEVPPRGGAVSEPATPAKPVTPPTKGTS